MPFFRVKPSFIFIDVIPGTRTVRKAYHEGQIVELASQEEGGQAERLELVTESELEVIKAKLKQPIEGEAKSDSKPEKIDLPKVSDTSRAAAVSKLKGEPAKVEQQEAETF